MKKVCVIAEDAGVNSEDVLDMVSHHDEEKIYGGRNSIYKVQSGNRCFAVKIFGGSFLRGLLYSFRKSKARRSFENALILQQRGIHTPAPVAYTEERAATGRLLSCCYICEFEESETLGDFFESADESFVRSFAEFVARLHCNGIRHDDLNATNVRVRQTDGGYEFGLIDLNRMKIYAEGDAVPLDICFENLTRFSCLTPRFRLFINEYLAARNMPATMAKKAVEVKEADNRRVDMRKKIKNLFRSNAHRGL